MRMFRLSLAALCMALLVLTGCSKGGSSSGNAQLRILNAFSEAAALNVSVASTRVVTTRAASNGRMGDRGYQNQPEKDLILILFSGCDDRAPSVRSRL